MIVLTSGGHLSQEFKRQFDCQIVSFRHLQQAEMDEVVRKAQVIIHSAANLNPQNLSQAVEDNFTLTKQITDTILRVKPGVRFIYLSSMSMLKSDSAYLEPGKMTDYAFSKYLGEIYCLNQKMLNVAVVRFSTLFYNDAKKDGLSNLISQAKETKTITLLNNGSAERDFISLSVAVKYLHKIVMASGDERIFNVASGKAVSFKTIAAVLKQYVPALEVNNREVPAGDSVLSVFSTQPLDKLGRIEFRIEDSIEEVFKR